MRFKEFVKVQSQTCPDSSLKTVWESLLSKFKEPEYLPYYPDTEETQKKAKEVFNNVCKQKKEDNIENKRIWIMNFYSQKELDNLGLKPSDNVLCGYKSLINDDIVCDNGDEYVYIGKSPTYKFYLKGDIYYFRVIGNTTLNRVNEWNYDTVSEYLDYLDCK